MITRFIINFTYIRLSTTTALTNNLFLKKIRGGIMKKIAKMIVFIAVSILVSLSAMASSQVYEIFYNSPMNFGLPVMKVTPMHSTNEVQIVIGDALLQFGSATFDPDTNKKLAEFFEMEHLNGLAFTFPANACSGKIINNFGGEQLIDCSNLLGQVPVKVRGANLSWNGDQIDIGDIEINAGSANVRVVQITEISTNRVEQFFKASIFSNMRLGNTQKDFIQIVGQKERIRRHPIN